jgi:uncharacterized protein GlcG (DUF336 family)
VLAAAERAAAGIDVPVCIAVGDPGGNLVAYARMDGAPLLSASIAQDKAYTVTAFNGMPTHQWYGVLENEPALLHGIVKTDRFVIFGGGIALRDLDGALIGAVGVSGGSAEQDQAIAEQAAASLLG